MLSLQGHTQISSDSVVISTLDAKRVLEAAILSRQYRIELEDKDAQINTLLTIKDLKDSLISVKNYQIENYKKLSDLNESNYLIESNKRNILQRDFDDYKSRINKEIRSIKRKGVGVKILTGIVGAAVGIIVGTVFIK